ncbi:PAS domain-containing sensor histidine kinase [Parvularcula sp. IMCC14364]|uniref:sensor histidine kinase n=1 Tax=Parvularcula sp. IMCC14364 TaxID=3067902 RepID=UPI002740C9A5|nr:PAS domain-containing sensor histidine kinase [Parvularcula sp. IMCC14364]
MGKRRRERDRHKRLWRTGVTALAGLLPVSALAQETETSPAALSSNLDPIHIIMGGAVMLAVGAMTYALRVSKLSQNAHLNLSRQLADMEAKLDKSESVLAAHPGLVLVWHDSYEDIEKGWGHPRVLGGPAALASILTFADDAAVALANPAAALLNKLGELPLEEEVAPEDVRKLKDRVKELRSHGVAFSGSVVTDEGRSIEVDGRVAGDQVTLWLTDPAVRLAEDGGMIGKARDRAADLHGALNHLDRLPMASWRRGPDLRLEWVNSAYVSMVEAINLEEVLENQIEIDGAFKKLAERAREEFSRSTGRKVVDDLVVVNVRGMRRVLRIMEQPMHGAGEACLGGIAIDITKLDKAQEDLKRHQNAYRKTLNQMPSAVAVFSSAQQLDYYNQAFLELWKLDDADLRTRPYHGELLDKLHQKSRLPAWADYNKWKEDQLTLYTEGQLDDWSMDNATPDEIWSLPNGKTLRVARQRHPLGGVVVVFEDITENLRLETEFNTQISVQRATLNNLEEGVAVFASDGKLRLYNSAFLRMWQFDPAKLAELPDFVHLAKQFNRLSTGDSAAWKTLKARVTSFAPEDRTPIEKAEVVLKDGRSFAYGTAPLPDGATLLTFLDVTDSREREKELQERNEWLETADRIKSKFVNHISYNLRNPLNTIIGFAEMLETEMFGTLNDRQKDYAASILSASNHLLDLINDIIDLAAIDAGKLDLELKEIDVKKTLENAATYAALKAEDSAVTLNVEVADDIGAMVADEKRIKQALFNLLANAFSFTDEGGCVTLAAERDGNTIRISVNDTGRGVSPEDQEKAFDRFESRGPGSGAGLGLSLVKSFIELHGGWVRLSSSEGTGTQISCHLPANGPATRISPEDEAEIAKTDSSESDDETIIVAAE